MAGPHDLPVNREVPGPEELAEAMDAAERAMRAAQDKVTHARRIARRRIHEDHPTQDDREVVRRLDALEGEYVSLVAKMLLAESCYAGFAWVRGLKPCPPDK